MARRIHSRRTAEYWKKRFAILEALMHNRSMDDVESIAKLYDAAQREIEKQLAVWYQRFADNNGITLQSAKKILTGRELKEFQWDVNEYIKRGEENAVNQQWMKELENASDRVHISRLEAIKVQIQHQVEVLYGNQLDQLDKMIHDTYTEGYYRTGFEIQKGIGLGWDFATLDQRLVDKVVNRPWAQDGVNFSDRVWKNKDALVRQLNTTLTQDIILGKDPQKTINEMSKRLQVSKSAAGRLVMTEEAAFASAARQECFKDLDVEQFEVVVTLDGITCETCQPMDGKVFKMSDYEVGTTAPPFHVRCRCTTAPHFDDDFGSVGQRAARGEDGKTTYVPADMTYEQWQDKFVLNSPGKRMENAAKENGIRGIINTEPKPIDLSEFEFDNKHINEIRKHGVTKQDAQEYVNSALVSFKRFNGQYECYFSSAGATYINTSKKTIRTAFKREQYDEKTSKFIKEVEEIVKVSADRKGH